MCRPEAAVPPKSENTEYGTKQAYARTGEDLLGEAHDLWNRELDLSIQEATQVVVHKLKYQEDAALRIIFGFCGARERMHARADGGAIPRQYCTSTRISGGAMGQREGQREREIVGE